MSELPVSETMGSFDANQIAEVKSWLAFHYQASGKVVPDFEYTPANVKYLHNLATVSQANQRSAEILAADFRQKASEYRFQSARIGEILQNVGLGPQSLPLSAVESARFLANMANLLNIRDTELISFMVAVTDLSIRKSEVQERMSVVQRESKDLLDYTRRAITRLTYLKRAHAELEADAAASEAKMENWKTSLSVMTSKEQQYLHECADCKGVLERLGYSPEISHGALVEMGEQKKEIQRKTEPIVETLRSYQDLPPDKALAALAIEEKRGQFGDAERYLDALLHSTLSTSE